MSQNCSLNCSGIGNTTLNNGLCRHYTAFETENVPRLVIVLNSTLNIIPMIVSILANSLVMAAVWRTPSLRYPSIVFLCGLALSDVAVGLVVEPLFITVELSKIHGYPKGDDCRLETAFFTLAFVVCGVSFGNITLISLDRYLAIQYPLRYDTIVTIPRVYFLIISCWIVSILSASIFLWNPTAYSYVVSIVITVFLGTSTVIHIKIYRIVRRHRSEIQAQEQAVNITNAEFNMTRFRRTCINTFLVYYFLLLCYLPFSVAWVLDILIDSNFSPPLLWKLANTTLYLNSALNPFLYCWRLPTMRGPVMFLFKKIFCKYKISTS